MRLNHNNTLIRQESKNIAKKLHNIDINLLLSVFIQVAKLCNYLRIYQLFLVFFANS